MFARHWSGPCKWRPGGPSRRAPPQARRRSEVAPRGPLETLPSGGPAARRHVEHGEVSVRGPREVILGPLPALGRPEVRLVLVSATVLFTELLLIRWIPANIRYVGFFPNFLLISSFLGIGVGIMLGRRFHDLPVSPFAIGLFAVVVLVANVQLNVQLKSGSELVFGIAANSGAADVNFVVLPLVIVMTTLLMAAIALPLGPLLRSMPPLRAYGFDIVG